MRQHRCRFSARRSITKATNPPRSTGLPLPPFVDVRAVQEKPSRETDLYAWLLHQANELRARQPNFIDWSELAEELDEIVALARKETVSRLRTVLVHLLKWKYQTKRRDERSWKTTIVRERLDLSLLLESKNLHNYMLPNRVLKNPRESQNGYWHAFNTLRKNWLRS